MSGHSKWATTKRHKAAIDQKRGKIFSVISKELSLAARDGGADTNFNARLRMIVSKAKAANMPADNIERAIKKGCGELPGMMIEQLTYEGYAPGGVGVVVEVTTDNKNRSASEVRSTFTKGGGNLAGAGALSFTFKRSGQFLFDATKVTEEALMETAIEAGAEDVRNEGDHFEVYCEVTDFFALSSAFEEAKLSPESSELVYVPISTVPVTDAEVAKQVLKLISNLEDLEDTHAVYSNFDIDDSLLSEAGS